MKPIIKLNRSIIPSCDFQSLEKLRRLIKETSDIEGLGAYKIGFELVLENGLNAVIEEIRRYTELPVIYDHQKAGTDIPEMGYRFIKSCNGVSAVILFPFAGISTETEWINSAKEHDMPVIIGGEMTHRGFLLSDGGFIDDNSPARIYEKAVELGVADFVVPGNKPDKIKFYREIIESECKKPVYYSPGFIEQGGSISESAKSAGERWHAIVGRAIYQQSDMHKAVKEIVKCFQNLSSSRK